MTNLRLSVTESRRLRGSSNQCFLTPATGKRHSGDWCLLLFGLYLNHEKVFKLLWG